MSSARPGTAFVNHSSFTWPSTQVDMRNLLAIARALILRPEILVLDEAVSALDSLSKAQVLDLLNTLKARDKLSLVFVSHDLTAVKGLVDHILILKEAEMVEYNDTATTFSAPVHPYTRALLAAAPPL